MKHMYNMETSENFCRSTVPFLINMNNQHFCPWFYAIFEYSNMSILTLPLCKPGTECPNKIRSYFIDLTIKIDLNYFKLYSVNENLRTKNSYMTRCEIALGTFFYIMQVVARRGMVHASQLGQII